MGLFGVKKNRDLEACLARTHTNMANNYKDAAQEDFRQTEEVFGQLKVAGKLSEKQISYYDEVLGILRGQLKGYTHKDQNARWMG